MGRKMFRLPHLKLSDTGDGLVAVGATFLSYAATVLLHGNGFIAVFVAGLAIRSVRPEDEMAEAEKADFRVHVAKTAFSDISTDPDRSGRRIRWGCHLRANAFEHRHLISIWLFGGGRSALVSLP
jgi:hypothetical protein